MNGTRFARTGRCRFVVCLGILVLMVGMVAIFHSSQVQLDEIREQRLRCEQEQEALNDRLTTLVEQKYHLEKNQEREHGVQLETKRNLEQKIKELEEKSQKEQVEQQMRYDKLKQTHTILQSDHKHLKEETQKANKQQLDNINGLEKKLQSIRSELQKEKSNKSGELIEWREKYNIAEKENKRLHDLLLKENQISQERVKELEQTVTDYRLHCDYKAMDNSRKPVAPKPDMTNPSTSEKSFKHQDTIVPKAAKRIADDEQQQQEKPNRQQLIAQNDKKQLARLGGELVTTTNNPKIEQERLHAASKLNGNFANVRTARGSSTSSSGSPPLAFPPNQRKLPENVAPIPDNFEDLLQKSNNENAKSNDNPTQLEENLNHNFNENKAIKSAINNNNYDSGAHEIKDVMAEGDSNNMQHDDDINNFFDNDQGPKEHNKINNKEPNDDKDDDGGNDDDDGGLAADNDGGGSILGGAAAGDIAVKHNQQQQLLDDSLRNEIADDQGKEFGDGLRLDEGAMEEDDDDDYSNPSARKNAGGQAIRN